MDDKYNIRMMSEAESEVFSINPSPIHFPKSDRDTQWKCYLFGNLPDAGGLVYTPAIGHVPNWFVRWMMKVCLACTWVKTPETKP